MYVSDESLLKFNKSDQGMQFRFTLQFTNHNMLEYDEQMNKKSQELLLLFDDINDEKY